MSPQLNWFRIAVLGAVLTAAKTGETLEASAPLVPAWGFDFVYEPLPWLKLDLDGDFRQSLDGDGAADRIASAMQEAFAGGASLEAWRRSSERPRFPCCAPQPLMEDDSEDATVRFAHRMAHGVRLELQVFNLFDTEATDIDYFYPPLVPGELLEVDDLHRQPFKSQGVRVFVDWCF